MNSNDSFVMMEDVSFSFEEQLILNKVQLSLKKGISYALIGKSGVGKSTMLNLIAGFILPDQGRITINGQELKVPRKSTAFLFQDLGLFPWQTVFQAILMPLKMKTKKNIEASKAEVMTLLREMELENKKDKYPHELSGGEKQRVALARTLISKPDFLLMDEPTSSLDALTKEVIQELVLTQQQKLKATLLFVTHDIEEAVLLGERILLLNIDGTIQNLENPFFARDKAKEQLGFYETCIQIRRLMKLEIASNEYTTKNS